MLIFGEEIELHSRFLKLGQEYGSPAATAIANLHRHDSKSDDGVNDGVNDGVKLTPSEEIAVKAILRNPHLTAPELATILGTKSRQAERIRSALKRKVGLRHRGADKTGEWYFESVKGK